MGNKEIRVMLGQSSGDSETVQAWKESVGKEITGLSVKDNTCRIEFQQHTLFIEDTGQECCERRYMVCDDNLVAFIGAELLQAVLEDAPNVDNDGDHEVQFLHVKTTKGSFTISNHNEHNGYYGGFHIIMRTARKEGA